MTGALVITITETGNTEGEAIDIRFDSGRIIATTGELVPIERGGYCHVRGKNTQSLPECSRFGISFDRNAGIISFQNTKMYPLGISGRPNQIESLTLSFPPH